MSKYSDHSKPQFDITQYLPEVYRSDVNNSLFNMAFNRHFTKDDTKRVAGIIGQSAPNALVKRQIQEVTPHRQAYQLAPTMYSHVGTVEMSLSYKAFLQQLQLMGVETDRLPVWADTIQFNWVPPVNIDMLVNYQDYFWNPIRQGEQAQHFTIENRCSKSKSKLASYENVLDLRGTTFALASINFANNQFVIGNKLDDLFVPNFVFFTTNATNVNISDKFWTVVSSAYSTEDQQTTITVAEPIALSGATEPSTTIIGRWWFNSVANSLRQWTGTSWVGATQIVAGTISLAELRAVYQSETNCACTESTGWDMAPWDDNQIGLILWDANMFSSSLVPNPSKRIDFETEAEWIQWNTDHPQSPPVIVSGVPEDFALWFDTTDDVLKQWISFDGSDPSDIDFVPKWISVLNNFSAVHATVTGRNFWDSTVGCEAQQLNQWSSNNRWIHKSQVKSFSGVKRAQLPIFEYNSFLELNEWSEITRTWKFRPEADQTFVLSDSTPHRFELEPIKGYVVAYVDSAWYVYLFDSSKTINRDIDYTETFVPGFQFRVVDDAATSDVYTVHSSEYRMITAAEPDAVTAVTGEDFMCTVVRLVEPFASELVGGGASTVRLEPRNTSQNTPWRGYHLHWVLDTSNVVTTPTASKSWNYFRQLDSTVDPLVEQVAGNPDYTTVSFQPAAQDLIEIGSTYQEMTLSVPDVRLVSLVQKFLCDGTGENLYATPASHELRVYVNGIRQYGNYAEYTSTIAPDYTAIGRIGRSDAEIEFVTAIEFDRPLKALDIVRLEVGPASFEDMGMYCVPVRTVEDDTLFAQGIADSTQPVYRSLTQYALLEQVKQTPNQYPLFNVYDVITGDVVNSSPIFSFKESPTAPINALLQRRIEVDSGDYSFIQHLVDRDDNITFGYRDTSIALEYWFNPLTQIVQYWDDHGWTEHIPLVDDDIVVYRRAHVGNVAPTLVENQTLWFDTRQNKLLKYNENTNTWLQLSCTINNADPSLRTIWRRGLNDERAVPKYVDKDKVEITVGDPNGDWAIADQWTYNPQHNNKQVVKFSQVVTHFNSIVAAQPKTPGLQSGGTYALTQNEYNYALGGTIKEHNDSFDTLVSAVNVTNVTPLGVIENAAREYGSSLLQMRDLFTKVGPSLFTDYSNQSMVDLNAFITSQLIARYEQGDTSALVFGDTSAYDSESGAGMRNWISSAPIFSLAERYVPYINTTGLFVELVHHDGHRTPISFSAAESDKLARIICSTLDNRTNLPFGSISNLATPQTVSAFTTAFGSLRRGVYWYRIVSGTRILSRFEMYDANDVAPSLYINGIEIPDGTMYYNTASEQTFEKTGLSWVAITAPGAADISPMWVRINFSQMFAEVLLEIEQRLYDVTPDDELVFDFSTITSDTTLYNYWLEKRFAAYAHNHEITAPLINVDYTPSDPFTWNYVSSTLDTPPHYGDQPAMASSWQELYTRWFNTPYPHLEPWKLQGYTDKPTWWDQEYLATTGTRRWIYTHSSVLGNSTGMWENLRLGRVPTGQLLADGFTISTGAVGQAREYNYFSVNISNSAIGDFPPDSLLPPYFQDYNETDGTLRSLFTEYTTQISAPDGDYVFTDGGPIEWKWKTSLDYIYDQLMIAFMIQPMRFMHSSFGPRFAIVDGLQVEVIFKQVYSHEDTMFHGDIYDIDQLYSVRGLNQWYVNYNRRAGYDTNGEFRQLWAGWDPKMTYQFGGIADTSTFEIANKYIDIIPQDFNILLVNNGVFRDLWMDAFEVSLITIPPPLIQYNNQHAWKMEIDNLSSTPRPISYFGVKEYSQMPDPVLRTPITVEDTEDGNEFVVDGNQLAQFPPGTEFDVSDSTSDDGVYTVVESLYDSNTDKTHIVVAENIPSAV